MPSPASEQKKRESWGSNASFLLACVGYAVGLGNIWRFPYLCFKSGGGAFLLPYLVMLLLCGVPLLLLEILAGQYTRRGPVGALAKMCPLLKGAGIATVVISFWLCTYYNVILSWALVYLASSVSDPLPWTGCHNDWNTRHCWDVAGNGSLRQRKEEAEERISSAQEFYDHRVLNMTSGLEDFGSVRGELLGYLALAWVAVYFCLWKSVRTTGKVVYFTATIPYALLLVFLARSVTLPGAGDGVTFLLQPKWESMLRPKVWVYAAAQVFNSIGIAFGSLIAFASYNRFHRPNVALEAAALVAVDAATCLLCGICVFAAMGALARELGKPVDEVVTDGPGLVFVVFPHALSKMPMPQVWSAVFFAMLLFLGIDSQFATVEVIVTSLKDAVSNTSYSVSLVARNEFLVLVVCVVAFAFGIPNVFQGGIYFFQLVDYYAAALSLMLIAFCECAAVLWCYGARRLAANARDMTGRAPHPAVVLCWKFVSPIIWMCNLVDYSPPTYNAGRYHFPPWGLALGFGVCATSVCAIPLGALHSLAKAGRGISLCKRVRASLRSTIKSCPCGCESALDSGNLEAHGGNAGELIFACVERPGEEEDQGEEEEDLKLGQDLKRADKC